eukprot:m.1631120 g.1631120  ORF g.1631120 m.1631120 type:complete len:253 (+) comp25403_c0_seq1:3421-4179(+)
MKQSLKLPAALATLHTMLDNGADMSHSIAPAYVLSLVRCVMRAFSPEIVLLKTFEGEEAEPLAGYFADGVPVGVITIADGVAQVANARACTMNREVHRHADLAPFVRLQRVRDHFIFSVESTGALKAAELVSEAMACLVDKADLLLKLVQHALARQMMECTMMATNTTTVMLLTHNTFSKRYCNVHNVITRPGHHSRLMPNLHVWVAHDEQTFTACFVNVHCVIDECDTVHCLFGMTNARSLNVSLPFVRSF